MASLLFVALMGCATPRLETRPSTCDFRALDLNRRLCAERGGTFVSAGPCGTCTR